MSSDNRPKFEVTASDNASVFQGETVHVYEEGKLTQQAQRRAVDGEPFIASNIDLTEWRMGSDRVGGAVPDYIVRDIDADLDARLADPGTGFVVVAGPVKSGKTRTLLEALRRCLPDAVVVKPFTVSGADTLTPCLSVLQRLPEERKVLFVDDLLQHLPSVNLPDVVVEAQKQGVLVVATCHDKELNYRKTDAQAIGFNTKSLDLINAHKTAFGFETSTAEQARFIEIFPSETDQSVGFAGWFAAVGELKQKAEMALYPENDGSQHAICQSLLIAASQIAIMVGNRFIGHEQLVKRAQHLYTYIPARSAGPTPSDEQFCKQLEWATQTVGGTYAILMAPRSGETNFDYELADAANAATIPNAVDYNRYSLTIPDPEHCNNFGLAAYYTNQPDKAIAWFSKAVDSGHTDEAPKAMAALGSLHDQQGDSDKAIAWFSKAVDSGYTDHSRSLMVGLGVLHKERGDWDKAVEWFAKAVDSGHVDHIPIAMVNLGSLYQERGDWGKAVEWYNKTIDSGHTDEAPKAMVGLGSLHHQRGDWDEGIAWFSKAVDSGHADHAPAVMVVLGFLYKARGDWGKAVEWFTKAVDSGHSDHAPKAAVVLGSLCQERGDWDKAVEWFSKAVDSGHADHAPAVMVVLGFLYKARGDWDKAVGWYTKAVDSGHSDHAPKAMVVLGSLCQERGDWDKAVEWYRKTIDAGQTVTAPIAMVNLGSLHDQRGETDKAVEWYRKTIDAGQTVTALKAMVNLGVLYHEQGDWDKAVEWFTKAVDSGHDTAAVSHAKHMLEAMS